MVEGEGGNNGVSLNQDRLTTSMNLVPLHSLQALFSVVFLPSGVLMSRYQRCLAQRFLIWRRTKKLSQIKKA